MAFAIAVSAGAFEFVRQVIRPTLPLEGGDRIVGIRLWHTAARGVEEQALHDLGVWHAAVRSVENLGAFRTLERNLSAPDGQAWPVQVAEINASGFRVAGVRPLLGRALLVEDEQPAAPFVAVIGYRVWQDRLGGDPGIVGRTLRLGTAPITVVGVMPAGFEFPASHDVWTPLRFRPADYGGRQGPEVYVFGRLAEGVTLDEAQAELSAIGARMSEESPETHEHLRPQVMPYAESMALFSFSPSELTMALISINVPLVLLLVLVCGNVALLIFARAATREGEIVMRTALGATRGRIVSQLFAEALVLAGVAAAVGLACTGFALRWGLRAVEAEVLDGGRLPFWFDDTLAPATAIYAGLLAVTGAAIAGVLPALKITRRSALCPHPGAGASGLRFGGVWTAVIVTQVAVTVAFPAVAFFVRRDAVQIRSVDVGFRAETFLSARLEMDPEDASAGFVRSRADILPQYRRAYRELERRLEAEPGVVGVTVADRLPRMYHDRRFIEVDEGAVALPTGSWPAHGVAAAAFDIDAFEVLDTPILLGRAFHSGDLEPDRRVAIVNQSFVARVLGGRSPIGRRVRFLRFDESGQAWSGDTAPGPWHEIVGVVRDMGMAVEPDPKVAGFYYPLRPDDAYPVHLAVHVKGDLAAFAPRLRALATEVDPTLRLEQVQPLDQVNSAELQVLDFLFRLAALVCGIALVLSLAGIYSVMSFAVSRRTREIGIRIALGARPGRVVAAVFRRPLTHVGLGIGAGVGLIVALALPIYGGAIGAAQAGVIGAYAVLMVAVCLLACVVPTWRALRVEPTEALRADG
jgi:predicted permease